jgi:hypothetical protein
MRKEKNSDETRSAKKIIELVEAMEKIKSDPATIKKNTSSMTDNNGGHIKF